MKYYIYILFLLFGMSSCQIKEEMTVNKDGSGEYHLGIDMSELIKATKNVKKNIKDSLGSNQKDTTSYKSYDSVFLVSSFYKKVSDSLELSKKEKKALKELKDLVVHLKVDEKANIMNVSYVLPYKNFSQLENLFQNLRIFNRIENRYKKKKSKPKEQEDMFDKLFNYKVHYSLRNNIFTRKTIPQKKERTKAKDSLAKKEDISNFFTYEMIYHFPSPIKEIKYKGEAKMSADRKTLFISIPANQFDSDSELLDFQIILE